MDVIGSVVGVLTLLGLLVYGLVLAHKQDKKFMEVQNANIRMCEKVGACADAVTKAVKNDL